MRSYWVWVQQLLALQYRDYGDYGGGGGGLKMVVRVGWAQTFGICR
jgi:hypothetical protein